MRKEHEERSPKVMWKSVGVEEIDCINECIDREEGKKEQSGGDAR